MRWLWKSRLKLILVIIGFVLIALLAITIWLASSDTAPTEYLNELPGELQPYAEEFKAIKQLQTQNPEAAGEKANRLIERLPEAYRRWATLAFEAGISDIAFYGRVIDQYGRPIEGAEVSYEAGGKFLGAGSGFGGIKTDATGRFKIEAKGGHLTIQNIKHPDIMFAAPDPEGARGTSDMYFTQMTFWDYPRTVGNSLNDLVWRDYTKENPYVFDVWRIEHREKVLRAAVFGGVVPPDGSVYTLDLSQSKLRDRVIRSKSDKGHLLVTCMRKLTMEHYQDYDDWQITLTPVQGGIQPTDDRYLNLAPETGYQSSITVGWTLGDSDYRHSLPNQRYYFTAHDGQVYGSLYVNFMPFQREEFCDIEINYKVNLQGSRHLYAESQYR